MLILPNSPSQYAELLGSQGSLLASLSLLAAGELHAANFTPHPSSSPLSVCAERAGITSLLHTAATQH